MTQDEILTRAREAYIKGCGWSVHEVARIRRGERDDYPDVKTAIAALTDAHLPLSEIVPPDPDLLAAREWAAEKCPASGVGFLNGSLDHIDNIKGFLAGCRHTRGEGA